jgi:hypothetical protein
MDIPVLVQSETVRIVLVPINQMNQVLSNVICEFCQSVQSLCHGREVMVDILSNTDFVSSSVRGLISGYS